MDGILDNLINALNTWNSKFNKLRQLLTQSPQTLKGGSIWSMIVNIHSTLQKIGLALLVLFFIVGIIKTCTSWQNVKRPKQVFKLFLRFAIARGLVVYGMEIINYG